jgi:hypothetical protein
VRNPQVALWDELDDDVRVRIDELVGDYARSDQAAALRMRWLGEARLRGFRTAAAIRALFADHQYASDLQEVCIRTCRSNHASSLRKRDVLPASVADADVDAQR